jgi:putative ABC transport system permease protein
MLNLLQQSRQSVRDLARSPGFTFSAVITLAVGMAATTIIFSTVFHLLLRPLPFRDWQELRYVFVSQPGGSLMTGPEALVVEEAMRSAGSFDALEAWAATEHSLTGQGEPVMLKGAQISAGLPSLLGVSPLVGRTFTDAEVAEGEQLVLLSETLWRTRFGANRSVIGSRVRLGPDTWTVVGVMPHAFGRYETLGEPHEYWLPLRVAEARFGISAIARVRSGIDPAVAAEELDAIAGGVGAGTQRRGPGWSHSLRSPSEIGSRGINAQRALPRLFMAASLLLLIGCANVAGLLLIRMYARRRELAVRSALGAHHVRLVGELAVEQLLIGAAAGVVGILLAIWGIDLIRAVRPPALAVLDNVSVNLPVLAFAAVVVLATTLLFGLLPALAVMRHDLAGTLHNTGGPRVTAGNRARSVLVTLQLALATMLLVGGFLLVRTLQQLERQDLGFNTGNLLVANVPLPPYRYDGAGREALVSDLVSRLRDLPDVQAVAVGQGAPPRMGLMFVQQLEIEASDVSTEGIQFLRGGGISPGWLATLGARMLEGREFTDAPADENASIVSRAFADRFWPGQSAVGGRFRLSPDQPWQTVVGVVGDLKMDGPGHAMGGELMAFWPVTWSYPGATLLVRTSGDAMAAAPALRQIMAQLDAELPIRELASMRDRVAGTLAAQRFNMIMIGLFAAAAVLLCAIGLYGLVSYSYEQRVREVGIRLALGATAGTVRALFMSQALRLAAIGVAMGLAGALASARVMQALVHGISPRDPLAFLAAVAVITLVALAAAWLPAHRAAGTQPVEALRRE